MANHLGTVTDMEDFKQKIQKQKRRKNKAVQEYKKYFPAKNTDVLEIEPEPVVEIEKQTKLQLLSSAVYDRFTKSYNAKINQIEKFKHPYNKANMLKSVANSYHQGGDVEKAGVILAQAFNALDKEEPYRQNEIKSFIESKENKKILEDFFYCSNNIKAKYFVMKSLNKLDNPYYLPIAEAVCDCDSQRVAPNDKKTIYEAKLFLNRYYDLNMIYSYIDENDNYKIGALNLLSKWGLEKHQKLPQKLFDDENEYVYAKARQTESNLKRASNFIDIEDDNFEPNRLLPEKNEMPDRIKLLKYIEENKDRDVDINSIKQLGQVGITIRDAQAVRPEKDNTYSRYEAAKAEAFLKIVVRGNIKKSYLD